ncbi:hypothetical protein G647_05124 [Cladophialophora carrionii CBS 160.54]|uniref:RRM domain-containing protein n=1 Tax=Cladophialophora carrionii CBS 160.54 TaxID=1279043 RepID=V9D8S8_9EURO|nr:uncharacterized protein G647_05124 [Cladophialophora carrionii CBS 160.54]ETI23324.1 hypothetical protein G647_05124 [Cladophialophora carrionii CBS 160.54]
MSPHGAAMSSSPHSVDETTNHGTPSTNITAFTPEAGSGTKGRVVDSARRPVRTLRPGQLTLANDESEEDIFLSAPSTKGTQLSPTAEVFTPTLPTTFMKKDAEGQAGNTILAEEYDEPIRTPHKFEFFPNGVPAARRAEVEKHVRIHQFGLIDINQVPFNNVARIYVHDITITDGVFSTDEGFSRSFLVSGVPFGFPSRVIGQHFTVERFPSLRGVNATKLPSGLFVVSCSDIREAKQAVAVAKSILPFATLMPCSGKTYAREIGADPNLASDYEGQMILSIYYNPNAAAPPVEAHPVIAEIKRLLDQCGDVKAFHTCTSLQTHVREIRVEFYNADHVDVAKDVVRGTVIQGCVLDARPYQPDVRVPIEDEEEIEAFQQLSITGRSRVPVDDDDYARLAHTIHRDGLHRGRRVAQNMNHNAVDVARIQAGLDVRTTIMLRNIPNRVDQPMLKTLLDVTSRGRYDFMYLRIDFANNCNVGYAFINFIDAQSIIPFVLARAGKRWNCFNSDKVAEVSYATIQGKDCLVQKFRNSSVMLEHPAFRPKLFLAGNFPNAGQEEPFPGPDNQSKMRRSVENAEHVGLFVPLHADHQYWYPQPFAPAPAFQQRNPVVRPAGRFNHEENRRRGVYLPPARIVKPEPMEPKDFPQDPSPTHRRIPFLVDIRSPYDPFAGRPSAST